MNKSGFQNMMKTFSVLLGSTLVGISSLGIGLSQSVSAASDSTALTLVLVTCGPHGAVRVVEANKVPPGCRVSTINSPPAGR
jgi:hypothetical protein